MQILSKILRNVSLSILFGGSATLVFAAIVLVKAAHSQGIPIATAAANNAPLFLNFSKVALGAGLVLLAAELLDFFANPGKNKLTLARYASSLGCILSTLIFAFVIVPSMQQLLPDIKTVQEAYRQFHYLHEVSRLVFGSTILLSLISLLLSVFESPYLRHANLSETENSVHKIAIH